MCLKNGIKDIIEDVSKIYRLTLPTMKQNNLKIQYRIADHNETVYGEQTPLLPFACSDIYQAPIASWSRLTSTDAGCKVVYEVTFDLKDSNFNFKAGDTIGIIPKNNSAEVDNLIDKLGVKDKADLQYSLSLDNSQKTKIPMHIPVQSSLREVFTQHVDLRSVLKKLFMLALSSHTKDPQEKQVLEYLCSKEGSTDYNNYILNRNFCILDLLNTFKSCKPPVEVILSNLPRLMPRPYSIVNSGLKDSDMIKICFSIVEINGRKGITTGWLEEKILKTSTSIENDLKNMSLNHNMVKNTVPIYIRKNTAGFCLPQNIECPVLMIGPGTGVAPFIGFLEEREYHKCNSDIELGQAWLFFGCRNPELDFIYEADMKQFLCKGILNKLNTAFSRVSSEIKYIQDSLAKEGEDVTKFIKNGATVYICGDINKIAPQIKETLVKCIEKYDNKPRHEAEQFIIDMQKNKKYVIDTWS